MTAANRHCASPLPTLATWALWLLSALLLVFVVAVPMDVTQQLVFPACCSRWRWRCATAAGGWSS